MSRLGFILAARRDSVIALLRDHGIEGALVFGSVARGDDDRNSDIDLAIETPAEMGMLGMAKLEMDLEKLLDTRVDLVPARLMKPEVAVSSEADLVPL